MEDIRKALMNSALKGALQALGEKDMHGVEVPDQDLTTLPNTPRLDAAAERRHLEAQAAEAAVTFDCSLGTNPVAGPAGHLLQALVWDAWAGAPVAERPKIKAIQIRRKDIALSFDQPLTAAQHGTIEAAIAAFETVVCGEMTRGGSSAVPAQEAHGHDDTRGTGHFLHVCLLYRKEMDVVPATAIMARSALLTCQCIALYNAINAEMRGKELGEDDPEAYAELIRLYAAVEAQARVAAPEELFLEVFGLLRAACESRGEKLTPSVRSFSV